jgi:hypothetical protein
LCHTNAARQVKNKLQGEVIPSKKIALAKIAINQKRHEKIHGVCNILKF